MLGKNPLRVSCGGNLIRVSCGETYLGFIFVTLILRFEFLTLCIFILEFSIVVHPWLCSLVLKEPCLGSCGERDPF